MKLMTKAANRDRRSNRLWANPPGPSVSGARSSSTRIVIAIANTPSTSVSRRFLGSPRTFTLADSVALPRVRQLGPDFKTLAFAMGFEMTFSRRVVASGLAVQRVQVLDRSDVDHGGNVVLCV